MVRALCGSTLFAFLLRMTPATAAQAPSLDVYGRLPAFEQAAISLSGTRVALVGMLNGTRSIVIIGNDNKAQRTFPIGDLKIDRLRWAGDDRLLVEYRNTAVLGLGFTADKAELTTMMVLSVADGSHWNIFEHERLIAGGFRRFYGLEQRADRWYGYFSGITLDQTGSELGPALGSTQPVLYEVDLTSHKTRAIAARSDDPTGRRDWVIGPDGAVAATFDIRDRSGDWTIRNAAHEVIASGRNARGDVGLLGLGRAGNSVMYIQEDETSGTRRYYELALAGGNPTKLATGGAAGEPLFDKHTRELIGYFTEEDYPQTRFFDDHRNAVIRGIANAFPGRYAQLRDWNGNFHRYIVETQGGGDPGTWWLLDVDAGSTVALGTSYLVPAALVGPVSVVNFQASDGLKMSGVLTLPPNRDAKHLPVIVFPHGGPAARDYPSFDWWAQAFAVQGYAVFQPNFRGSTGFGAAFERAGHGEWGRRMQTDISDGLAELAREGIVDAKRACIMGGSYGGYAALAGVTVQQGVYRCAVSVAGVADLKELYQDEVHRSAHSSAMIEALDDVLGKYETFDDISPIHFAARADAPVLLIHGKDDTVVNYSQSKDMERALRSAGKPVELVTLAGEDHWLSKSATRLEMLTRASEFIRRYNPPD